MSASESIPPTPSLPETASSTATTSPPETESPAAAAASPISAAGSTVETSLVARARRLMGDVPAQTPRPPSREQRLRAVFVASLLLAGFAALAGRVAYIQLLRHDELADKSRRQNLSVHEVPGKRGSIYSADGSLLASHFAVYDLAIDPVACGEDIDERIEQLANVLGKPVAEFRSELEPHLQKRYRRLQRDLSGEQLTRLRALRNSRGRLPYGVVLEERAGRVYPQGPVAAALLGFVTWEGQGASGVERQYDEILRGQPGRLRVRRDARQVEIASAEEDWVEPPVDGADIVLTIDLQVQTAAEIALTEIVEEWKPLSAVAVVVEVHTGDILAMASRPTFDPNHYNESKPEEWMIRAVTNVFEPGSTFKTFALAMALNEGSVTLDTMIDCEGGRWRAPGGRVLKDVHPENILSVEDVLVESSNVGAGKVTCTMWPDWNDPRPVATTMHRYLTTHFGFGRRTGIGLPGELPGLVRPADKWGKLSITSIPMGYEVMVTPLQLAVGYATIGSGGVYRRPRMLADVRGAEDRELPQFVVEAMEPRHGLRVLDTMQGNRDVRRALGEVVRRGTAKRVEKLEPPHEMGGKTGTAHKIDPKRGGYVNEYLASFAAIAPIDDPKFACIIIVDQPEGAKYGGTVAAPGVRDTLQAALRARPPATTSWRPQADARDTSGSW